MKYQKKSVQSASEEVVEYLKEQEGIGGLIAVDLKGNCKPVCSTITVQDSSLSQD